MSANEVNYRDPGTWVRDPYRFRGYPPPGIRRQMRQSPAGRARLDEWSKFFAGFSEKPPVDVELIRGKDRWRVALPASHSTMQGRKH